MHGRRARFCGTPGDRATRPHPPWCAEKESTDGVSPHTAEGWQRVPKACVTAFSLPSHIPTPREREDMEMKETERNVPQTRLLQPSEGLTGWWRPCNLKLRLPPSDMHLAPRAETQSKTRGRADGSRWSQAAVCPERKTRWYEQNRLEGEAFPRKYRGISPSRGLQPAQT